MLKKNIALFLIAASVPAVILTSCKGQEEKPDVEVTTDTISEDAAAEMTLMKSSIPSPLELTNEISKAKFNYNKSMLNSSSKAASYSNNFQKAVNAGIYGADLGYAISFSQAQDGIEYFGAVNKLAKDLGLESIFDEEMMKKMGENVGKKDTLLGMIDQAYNKAERNLRSNQRVSTATLMAAGGWVEGIYLVTSTLKDQPKDDRTKPLFQRAWSHVSSFRHVIELLDHYKKNADCAKMLDEIKEIQPIVDRLNSTGQGVLEPADITELHTKISAVRNKLTS